ncbi:MAG: hypothetical protein EXR77_10955 [Myxococcales bacterium]|nr:hypothetical protein [Myxococcales bacterium]
MFRFRRFFGGGRCAGSGSACGRRSVIGSMLAVAVASLVGKEASANPNRRHERGPQGEAGEHPGGKWMQAKIEAHVADALDVAKATPEQRKAVQAEVESLLGKGKAGMQRHHQQRKAALDVFASDKPDARTVAALVNTFLDSHDESSKGIAAALTRMHAIFRPEQRKAIANYVSEVMPTPKGKWQQRMGQFWAERMTDRAFDHLQCTPDQRKSLVAIRERVTAQFEAMHGERRKHLEGALTLWQAERLDAAAVQGHLDIGRKRAQLMADFAVAQALEVHKVLTPQQRAKLVQFAQKWRGGGHHGGPAGFGGAGGPADGQE